jgi:hypothetical protein
MEKKKDHACVLYNVDKSLTILTFEDPRDADDEIKSFIYRNCDKIINLSVSCVTCMNFYDANKCSAVLTFSVSSGKLNLQLPAHKSGTIKMIQSIISISRIFKRQNC